LNIQTLKSGKVRKKRNYWQAPVVMLHLPLPPPAFLHFFFGFCLMTAGRQTPRPLHRRFLIQAGADPAGLNPQGLLAL